MDLSALKNLDIKDLLNKIKGAGLGNILQDKKILIKFDEKEIFRIIVTCNVSIDFM